MALKERFESKYIKDSSGCWLWIGNKRGKAANGGSYGAFKIGVKNHLLYQ